MEDWPRKFFTEVAISTVILSFLALSFTEISSALGLSVWLVTMALISALLAIAWRPTK